MVVLTFGVQAHAGTITQFASFTYQEHDSRDVAYKQLDPALAPLNAVAFSVNATGTSGPWTITNPTLSTLSFMLTISSRLSTDAGNSDSASTVPVTLGPQSSQEFSASQSYSGSLALTTNLSSYIGTGMVPPFGNFSARFSPDNSQITVMDGHLGSVSGTESVSYFYGPTPLLPEPTSLFMLSLGLATVGCVAWPSRCAA